MPVKSAYPWRQSINHATDLKTICQSGKVLLEERLVMQKRSQTLWGISSRHIVSRLFIPVCIKANETGQCRPTIKTLIVPAHLPFCYGVLPLIF